MELYEFKMKTAFFLISTESPLKLEEVLHFVWFLSDQNTLIWFMQPNCLCEEWDVILHHALIYETLIILDYNNLVSAQPEKKVGVRFLDSSRKIQVEVENATPL